MPLAILKSRSNFNLKAPEVTIEVHICKGTICFSMVGLPETAVKESKDRVRSAIINSGYRFTGQHITVNLAPAELPKQGARFDLAIALGMLIASGEIKVEPHLLENYEFAGELALSGELRPTKGMLPFALATKKSQRALIIPLQNLAEAKLAENLSIYPAKTLTDVINHLCGKNSIPEHINQSEQALTQNHHYSVNFSDVQGQYQAKRAFEIAATGKHSLLLSGPPGTGKTMLANRLITILPPMNNEDALECASIYSISNQGFKTKNWCQRPFRSPHHTASSVALVGGGSPPAPGEITLAHHGVLFLDELPEFQRQALEALREPLEAKTITISRANRQSEFPANFQLIAAMNPCPCGHAGNPQKECSCSIEKINRYKQRLSGPLLDRIDMQIEVPMLPMNLLTQQNVPNAESSAEIQQRVIKAQAMQKERQKKLNALLTNREVKRYCILNKEDNDYLTHAIEKLQLSPRSYQRLLKLARTICDLSGNEKISRIALQEALSYQAKC